MSVDRYGLWSSPLTPRTMASSHVLRDVAWDDDGQTLTWLEESSGYGTIFCQRGKDAPRMLNPERSARASVGYGGGTFTASHGHAWYISEGRLYCQPLDSGTERVITPTLGQFAAPAVSPDGRWVLLINHFEEEDCVAIADAKGEYWPQRIGQGHDFYMQPTWHPSGRQVAWISWNYPYMPWDATCLELAVLSEGNQLPPYIKRIEKIAGGTGEAVLQPSFSPDGRYLAYLSDRAGWFDLYLYDLADKQHRALVQNDAEIGGPAWAQGLCWYGWAPDSTRLYFIQHKDGTDSLWQVSLSDGHPEPISGLDIYRSLKQIRVSAAGKLAMIASGPHVPPRLIVFDPSDGAIRIAARSSSENIPVDQLGEPFHITWETDNESAHGLLYLPAYNDSTTKPPLIVHCHGGPTSEATMAYSDRAQFFVTRGYAFLDVNYRGSSGYGRAYRERLYGNWGLFDVDDAVAGARYAAGRGWADPERMVIMGGSAGGYTVLEALARYPGTFRAGICLYGISNLFALAAETHKFERRYTDQLLGPLPEAAQIYRDRSPIFHAEKIRDPIAIYQGEEDRVVPPNQAKQIASILKERGIPCELTLFPGEGHGWRRAETITAFYTSVLDFLARYVLFT